MYIDASGNQVSPTIAAFPDGRPRPGFHQMVGPGERVGFDMAFMDRSPSQARMVYLTDGKKEAEPKSIDEALRQEFARKAQNEGTTVESLLANMGQSKLEEMAADVARRFVSSLAGAGIAHHFKDGASLTAAGNAALGRLKVQIARNHWMADKSNAHRSSREPAEREPVQMIDRRPAPTSRAAVEDARAARCARLSSAYKG